MTHQTQKPELKQMKHTHVHEKSKQWKKTHKIESEKQSDTKRARERDGAEVGDRERAKCVLFERVKSYLCRP